MAEVFVLTEGRVALCKALCFMGRELAGLLRGLPTFFAPRFALFKKVWPIFFFFCSA